MSRPTTAGLVPWVLAAPATFLLMVAFAGPMILLVRVSLYESPVDGTGFYRPGTWSVGAYTEQYGRPFGRHVVVVHDRPGNHRCRLVC